MELPPWYDHHCVCENDDAHSPDDLWVPHQFGPEGHTALPAVYEFWVRTARQQDDRPVYCPLC